MLMIISNQLINWITIYNKKRWLKNNKRKKKCHNILIKFIWKGKFYILLIMIKNINSNSN